MLGSGMELCPSPRQHLPAHISWDSTQEGQWWQEPGSHIAQRGVLHSWLPSGQSHPEPDTPPVLFLKQCLPCPQVPQAFRGLKE